MVRWLESRTDTIWVTAEDGRQYAFTPRKTDPKSGSILVKGPDGRRYGVTGDREGDRFITNPHAKNARALLTQEEIDEAKGLAKLHDPLANELSAPKPIMEMTEEEAAVYLEERYQNGRVYREGDELR